MRRNLLGALLALGLAGSLAGGAAGARAEGWPRIKEAPDGTRVIAYQPQVDAWNAYVELHYRVAIEVWPPGATSGIPAALQMVADSNTDLATRTVTLYHQKIVHATFPGTDEAVARRLTGVVAGLVPAAPMKVSLDEILAHFEPGQGATPPRVEDAPRLTHVPEAPAIVTSTTPAVLVIFDGEPKFAPVEKTGLLFAVNTNWSVFREEGKEQVYLLRDDTWLGAPEPTGPWAPVERLPRSFWSIPRTDTWADVHKNLPGKRITKARMPRVFVSLRPAELILFEGAPKLAAIPGTRLLWATNTDSDLFREGGDGAYYFLASGRWFRAAGLEGPWTYAGNDLPGDFARIPKDHARARVRVSVPGTPEAEEAVMLAQAPHQAEVRRSEVTVHVTYSGEPQFQKIEGTTVSYAANTSYDVLLVENRYYTCYQAVWFVAGSPTGPWVVVDTVPAVIYTIPPSCPKYNVTYVRVYSSTPSVVVFGYTSGYMGVYVSGGCVVFGTGYYYPPYYYYPPHVLYPVYYPTPYTYGVRATYNPYTGVYTRTAYAYGPYGGIGHGAAYNPTTGTYARGVAAAGPYQAGFAAQAYNPRTGTYAATYQRSNPYQSWGESVVSRGDDWVHTGHYSDSRGTVRGAETSKGGKAIGVTTDAGHTTVAKSGQNNNMYATHDGNVYKNTGGGWQTYQDGQWQPVEKPQPPPKSGKGSAAPTQGTSPQERASAQGAGRERVSAAGERPGGGGAGTQEKVWPGGTRTGSAEWSRNSAELTRDQEARARSAQRQGSAGSSGRGLGGRSGGGGGRRR